MLCFRCARVISFDRRQKQLMLMRGPIFFSSPAIVPVSANTVSGNSRIADESLVPSSHPNRSESPNGGLLFLVP
jgi:hypothetical protein